MHTLRLIEPLINAVDFLIGHLKLPIEFGNFCGLGGRRQQGSLLQ
jgi:hypothetical protein